MILENVMKVVLRNADRMATLALNDFDSAFTDAVMPVLSNRFVWIPLYILLFWYLWRRLGWRKCMLVLFAAVLCIAAIDQFANLVKYSVARYRPCWDAYMLDNGLKVLERRGGKFGFFSAHAATCAGLATCVVFFLRYRWGGGVRYRLLQWLFAGWIVCVSISRVYVGKHFVGDIIAGAVVGMILARAISWLVHWAVNKFFPKFVA